MSLTAGTYMITVNCCIDVITGSNAVNQMLAGYSTSATSLSQSTGLAIQNGGGTVYGVGAQWVFNNNILFTHSM